MKLPVSFSDADKARMLALVGAATASLVDRSVSELDRRELRELIGLLSSIVHHEALIDRMAAMASQIALLEQQLAALQRATAN